MGFTCGIYKCPLYKNLSFKDIYDINQYFSYFNNDWAKEKFSSVEEFMKCYHYRMPTQDEIDFFKVKIHKDEWNYTTISDEIDSWCSDGRFLYDIIDSMGMAKANNGCEMEVEFRDLKSVILILNKLWNYYIENFEFFNSSVSFSFKSKESDDGEEEIALKPCDGIEIEFEDGTIKRKYTSAELDNDPLITTKNYFDAYDLSSVRRAISAFVKILNEIDFNNEFIVLNGGW